MVQLEGFLEIHIDRASDLINADSYLQGTSDPYVVVYLDGEEIARTKVINNNLNPVWDEDFTVDVSGEYEFLEVKLYDSDTGKTHNFLGAVSIDMNDLDEGQLFEGGNLEGDKVTGKVQLEISYPAGLRKKERKAALAAGKQQELEEEEAEKEEDDEVEEEEEEEEEEENEEEEEEEAEKQEDAEEEQSLFEEGNVIVILGASSKKFLAHKKGKLAAKSKGRKGATRFVVKKGGKKEAAVRLCLEKKQKQFVRIHKKGVDCKGGGGPYTELFAKPKKGGAKNAFHFESCKKLGRLGFVGSGDCKEPSKTGLGPDGTFLVFAVKQE